MASKNRSKVTASTSTGTVAPKKAVRKPPVIDRIAINSMDIPTEAPAAAGAPAAAPVAPAPSASPAPTPPPSPPSPAQPPSGTSGSAAPAGPAPGSSDNGDGVDFPVNTPPQVTVPSVPAGFVPVNPLDLRGWRPMQSELASLPDAVMELNNFANYTDVFGITAPPASQVSARLTVAAAWTTLYASTTAWYTYVKSQEGMAWKDALELFDKLKTPFQLAAASNPAMLNQYPAIARMAEAKVLAAKRGTSTKAKDKKAAQATAAQATAAAGTPAPAAPQTATGTAAPARVVTVQG